VSLEGELYDRATNYAGLADLIGSRFEYYRLPDSPIYPACTYHRVTQAEPARASGTDGALREATVQVDGWTRDAIAIQSLRDEIFAAFNRWAADGSNSGTVVQQSFHQSTVEQYEDDTGIYHVSLEFRMFFED